MENLHFSDDKPRFKHDCDSCKFLGNYEDYDLYFCEQGGDPTIVARYGNKGEQYQSGMSFARYDGLKHLYVGKLIAIDKGYLEKEPAEAEICTGCGHVKGDSLGPTALACCPDSRYLPLRQYISEQQIEQLKLKTKIIILEK